MGKYRWMISILWLFSALLALSVLVSLPVVHGIFGGLIDKLAGNPNTAGLARFLDDTGVPYLRLLLVLMIALIVLNHFIGLRWGFFDELRKCWKFVPVIAKQFFVMVSVMVAIVNADFAIEWLVGAFSESAAQGYERIVSRHISVVLFGLRLMLLNATYFVLITALILLGNSKRPAWERLEGKDRKRSSKDTSAQRVVLTPKQQRILRKAEAALEKGRIGRAARLFEKVGDLYAYRAGKLYDRLGEDDRAVRSFEVAGHHFAKEASNKRAGDAFYAARRWSDAAEQYSLTLGKPHHLSGNQLEDMVRNLGDAYAHEARFEEAANLYRDYGLHRLAGECFEKAGLGAEAGESYARAGDSEASAKIFEQSGRLDLAGLERGRACMVRGDFLKAAKEFYAIERFSDAALAFIRGGESLQAAGAYKKDGSWEKAAELFLEAGATEEALNCYIEIEDYSKAAQLASHLGLQDKQAMYYEKAGNYMAAARSYLMIQNLKMAVKCFKVLTFDSAEQVYACSQILQILMRQGRIKDALIVGEAILEQTRPTQTTSQLFFVFAAVKEKLGYAAHAADLYIQAAALQPSNKMYVMKAKQVATEAGLPFENIMAETIVQARTNVSAAVSDALDKNQSTSDVKPETSEAKSTPSDDTHTMNEIDESMVFDLAEEGTLSRYEMIQEIGRGGMGVVYKARDRRLDRLVAFKMLHPEYYKDPKVLLFFKREARAIAQLNHPNIVTLFDVGSEKNCFFMVMELVEGMTLEKLRSKYPKYVNQNFLGLLYETCMGLKVAHEKGVLHRDLKPSNLMVTKDGRVKIMDFGLAKKISDPSKTLQIWGTPVFMAPEVMQGSKATFASDIYSVGVTFYLLLTGQVPFDKDTMANKFIGAGLPTPPHELVPEVAFEVSETILKCMHGDPNERYQNAGELLTVVKLLGQQAKSR